MQRGPGPPMQGGGMPVMPPRNSVRCMDLLDQMRVEIEGLTAEIVAARAEKEEYGKKIRQQISDMEAIQRTITVLQNNHMRVKIQYDEDVARLRSQLDARNGMPGVPPNPQQSLAGALGAPNLSRQLPPGSAPITPRLALMSDLPLPPGGVGPPDMSGLGVLRSLANERDPHGHNFPGQTAEGDGAAAYKRQRMDPNMMAMGMLGIGGQHPQLQYRGINMMAGGPTAFLPLPSQQHNGFPREVGGGGGSGAGGSELHNSGENGSEGGAGEPEQEHFEEGRRAKPSHSASSSSSSVGRGNRESHAQQSKQPPPVSGGNQLVAGNASRSPNWSLHYPQDAHPVVTLESCIRLDSAVCCVRFSLDGKLLATGNHGCVTVWDVRSGGVVFKLDKTVSEDDLRSEADPYVRAVCLSPDGRQVAAVMGVNLVKVIPLVEGAPPLLILQGETLEVYSMDWAQGVLASGSGNGQVRLWDAVEGTCRNILCDKQRQGGTDSMTCVSLKPDASMVAASSIDKHVYLWSCVSGHLLYRMLNHEQSVYSVSFSRDGAQLVSAGLDTTLRLWDVDGGPQAQGSTGARPSVAVLRGHKDYVLSVGFTSEKKYIVSGSKDGTIMMWDAATTQCVAVLGGFDHRIVAVGTCPSDRIFATGGCDNLIFIWRYEDRNEGGDKEDGIIQRPTSADSKVSAAANFEQQSRGVKRPSKRDSSGAPLASTKDINNTVPSSKSSHKSRVSGGEESQRKYYSQPQIQNDMVVDRPSLRGHSSLTGSSSNSTDRTSPTQQYRAARAQEELDGDSSPDNP